MIVNRVIALETVTLLSLTHFQNSPFWALIWTFMYAS